MSRNQRKAKRQLLYKRLFLHPAYMFGVLCCGVLICGYSLFAAADNYQVTGVVPAPLLTAGANILYPASGAVTATAPLQVSGSCPNGSYVILLRAGKFSGVDQCSPTGTFTITTDLAQGQNQLQAQDYNLTNQAGPVSLPVLVDYQPAVQVSVSPLIPIAAANSTAPAVLGEHNNYHVTQWGAMQLSSDYAYQVYSTAKAYSWGLDLQGGKPPYRVTTDWGDGQQSKYYFTQDPVFTIKHQYPKSGVYTVTINSVDADNYQVQIQLSAVIRDVDTGAIINNLAGQSSAQPQARLFNSTVLLKVLWPGYFIVLLMSVSYWLGQHRELEVLRRRAIRQHRRRPA